MRCFKGGKGLERNGMEGRRYGGGNEFFFGVDISIMICHDDDDALESRFLCCSDRAFHVL